MNDTVVPIISVALILVLVYSVISILKPLPPFKRRWQALVCAPLAFFSLGLMSSLMDASTETTSPEIQPSETEVIETKNEPKVEGEGSATYPLQGTSDVEDVLPSLKPRSLDRNQPYRISKETPLMSELDQVNPIPVLSVAKVLDAGSIITVTAVSEMGGSPWYKVDASDAAGSYVGTGWINSTALLAQNLEPFVPNDDPEPSLPIEDTEASLPIKDTEASLPKNDTEGIALTKTCPTDVERTWLQTRSDRRVDGAENEVRHSGVSKDLWDEGRWQDHRRSHGCNADGCDGTIERGQPTASPRWGRSRTLNRVWAAQHHRWRHN